ncbi:hypothetical protein C8Q76DRAFT_715954 [Earliella scabrosa]|nr:hypothetical protein C8Q76DRAFT_715954 [Earliella scabrosa]
MSDWQDSEVAEFRAAYHTLSIQGYCTVATAVFFLYEAAITSGAEVRYFWKSRISSPAVLYFLNKYVAVAQYALTLAVRLPVYSDLSCSLSQKALLALDLAKFIPWAAFSALRAFALSKSWCLSILILVLSVVPFGLNVYGYFVIGTIGFVDPVAGCVSVSSGLTVEEYTRFVSISRGCLIVADVLLIAITLHSTVRRSVFSQLADARSLHSIMLRDGALYFLYVRFCLTGVVAALNFTLTTFVASRVLLILNILHLSFTLSSISINGAGSNITLFTEPCTTVLVGRFLIHLQEAGTRTLRVNTDDPLHLAVTSTPSFVRAGMGTVADDPSYGNKPEPEVS